MYKVLWALERYHKLQESLLENLKKAVKVFSIST